MIGPTTDHGWEDPEEPSMEQLLGYRKPLDGDAFIHQVLGTIAQRNRRRRWVLLGAAALAPVVALAIKPEQFSLVATLRLPVQGLGEALAGLPTGGLMGIALVCMLLVGVTRTVDTI